MALINCSECGKEVSDKALNCPNCGNPLNQSTESPISKDDEYLCCPNCNSKELHAEKQGYSGGKALAGVVLTGGIGLLAGTIGSRNVQITCLKCNNQFKAGEAKIVKSGTAADRFEKRIINLLCEGKDVEAQQIYEREMNIKSGLLPSSEWQRYHYKIVDKVQQSMTVEQIEKQRQYYEGLKNKKSGCFGMVLLFVGGFIFTIIKIFL